MQITKLTKLEFIVTTSIIEIDSKIKAILKTNKINKPYILVCVGKFVIYAAALKVR